MMVPTVAKLESEVMLVYELPSAAFCRMPVPLMS